MAGDDPKQVPSAPLEELIAAFGRSLAGAQQSLDASSMATLQQIYGGAASPLHEALRQIDYRPPFYVIPKLESELSIALSLSTSDEQLHLDVAPVDAEYQSRYRFDSQTASKLRFTIVPVPAPTRAEQLRVVPDVVGKGWSDASAVLGRFDLAGRVDPLTSADGAVVERQTPAAGELVEAGTVVTLSFAARWRRIDAGTRRTLYAITGDGASTLWVVGGNGFGAESHDLGESWKSMSMGVKKNLFTLVATPGKVLLAGGDDATILRRESPGSRWEKKAPPGGPAKAPSINGMAVSGQTVVAVGNDGFIAVSANEGKDWKLATSGTTKHLNTVAVSSAGFVVMGNDGVVLLSRNGHDWTLRSSGTNHELWAVYAADPSLTYAVGEEGIIMRWDGKIWQALPRATSEHLYASWGSGSRDVFVGGRAGTLLKSSNGAAFTPIIVEGIEGETIHAGRVVRDDGAMIVVGTQGLVMEYR